MGMIITQLMTEGRREGEDRGIGSAGIHTSLNFICNVYKERPHN